MAALVRVVVAAVRDSWTDDVVREWIAGLQHTLARTLLTGQRSHFGGTSAACAGAVLEDGAW